MDKGAGGGAGSGAGDGDGSGVDGSPTSATKSSGFDWGSGAADKAKSMPYPMKISSTKNNDNPKNVDFVTCSISRKYLEPLARIELASMVYETIALPLS